jgi:uncharacterized protein (UPF0332 family)
MKTLNLFRIAVYFSLFISAKAYALGTSSNFRVSGTVPVVLQTSIERTNDLSYTVREVSNNREGYVVTMETDVPTAKYNGENVRVVDGQVILTQVVSQDKSVDASKKLVFKSRPTYVRISVQVM